MMYDAAAEDEIESVILKRRGMGVHSVEKGVVQPAGFRFLLGALNSYVRNVDPVDPRSLRCNFERPVPEGASVFQDTGANRLFCNDRFKPIIAIC